MLEAQRAVILFASPHKNGHTARLLHTFLEQCRVADIQRFDCYSLNPAPCVDCGYCKSHKACSFHDLDPLYDALEQADLLLIASPVYNLSFPAPLKAVVDRMQRYFNQRFVMGERPPIAIPKKGILLLTSGSQDRRGVEIMETQCKTLFTILNTTLWETRTQMGTDDL